MDTKSTQTLNDSPNATTTAAAETPPNSEPQTATPPMSAQKDSPYVDQQVLPGQVIGYGLPTDQKVFGQLVTPDSGKFSKNSKLAATVVLAVVAAALTAAFLL